MISIKLVCVGRLKESWLTEACAEYAKRLSRYCRLSVAELAEAPLPERASAAQTALALEKEGADIIRLCDGFYTVALCIEGEQLTSEQLSETIDRLSVCGTGRIAFVIGSSCGLSDSVKRAADMRLSVSKMTFPHQLFRVVLLEQLYRAFSISAGAKYHK